MANSRRRLCTLMMVVALLLSGGRSRATGGQEISAEQIRSLKLKLVERINADRKKANLPPVIYLEDLSRLADDHCREMLTLDYLSHWNRAGLKPYMRYSLGGMIDHTAESAGRVSYHNLDLTLENVEAQLFKIHEGLDTDTTSKDMYRKNLLEPHHTHVGIGLAFNSIRMTAIEVFASRYITLAKPIPAHATLSQKLRITGGLSMDGFEIRGLSVFYDPPASARSIADLQREVAYGFPTDQLLQRAILPPGTRYGDGSTGSLDTNGKSLDCVIPFYRNRPGVYTVVVWIRGSRSNEPLFMATDISIFVEEDKPGK